MIKRKEDLKSLSLAFFSSFQDKTFSELPKPLCLNSNEHYKLQLHLKKYGHGENPRDPVISIDSVDETKDLFLSKRNEKKTLCFRLFSFQ